MKWSADQYVKFEDNRNRPIRDLLTQIPEQTVTTAADIGCGPGNSTELLQAHFPRAAITGIDSSIDMIAAARKRLPHLQFEIDSIREWRNPGPFDVILANSTLHWVPNHETLLPALITKLEAGGSLAVQFPDNLSEPVHHIMQETAAGGPWADKLTGASKAASNRHSPDWYYMALKHRVAKFDIWRTIYCHSLAGGAADVTEWFKGAGLRPFLEPLDETEKMDFEARFQEGVARAYPALPDGTVLLPFPRLFFVATL